MIDELSSLLILLARPNIVICQISASIQAYFFPWADFKPAPIYINNTQLT